MRVNWKVVLQKVRTSMRYKLKRRRIDRVDLSGERSLKRLVELLKLLETVAGRRKQSEETNLQTHTSSTLT